MPIPKFRTSYRTLMQRLALDRVKTSPRNRLAREAARLSGTAAAANVSPTPPNASDKTNRDLNTAAATTDPAEISDNAPTQPSTSVPSSTRRRETDPFSFASAAAVRSLRRIMAQSKEASLKSFQPDKVKQVSDQLRDRIQTAMKSGMEAAARAIERSTYDGNHLSPDEAARGVIRARRKSYAGSMPFDERWDGIMKNLAVLGMTSTGNTVVPYPDSADAFEAMWSEVDKGTKEVLWQTYICKDDYVGQRTVAKMAQAHRRGCQTELLYDCGGNISGRSRLTEELRQCGTTVIPYRPFFRSTFRYLTKLDWKISPGLRNHRKILLVDQRIGFCGGLNIGKEYCGPRMGGTGKFRDTQCSVVGPAVAHLREVYDDTKRPQPWKYGWTRFRQIASMQVERTVQQGTDVLDSNKQALQFFQDQTASMKRSSGVYFRNQLRRAERGIYPVIGRIGLRKPQEEKIIAMMGYYKKRLIGNGDDEKTEAPKAIAGSDSADSSTTGTTTATETTTSGGTADALPHGTDQTMCTVGAKAANATQHDKPQPPSDDGAAAVTSTPTPIPSARSRAMKRKTRDERVKSLYKATNLAHKRAYTSMILNVPIEDTEPVPEAVLYNELRPATTQILSCNPRFRNYSIQYAFWQVTRKCHRRIWITTPYYLPTRKLFKAMVQAARRGVDVRLLAGSNQTTDPWFMWHASNHITQSLLRAGVRIYEFKGSQIMHGKTVVVDSIWSSIGSYNWDVMSNKNLEVCLCHLDADVARRMEAQFLRDLAESEEVKLELHQQRSLWLRFTSWLFYNGVFLMDRITFRSFTNQDVEDSPDYPDD